MSSLVEENRIQHAWMEETALCVMERLTELDFEAADTLLGILIEAIQLHMRVETDAVLPVYENLDITSGVSPTPQRAVQLVDADHIILERVLRRASALLVELRRGTASPRRSMVLGLDVFVRLRGILEHHTLREQRDLYAHLDAFLDPDAREPMLRALRSTRSKSLQPTEEQVAKTS